MKMGIERVLKEKFGGAVKDIRQIYDEDKRETTVEVISPFSYHDSWVPNYELSYWNDVDDGYDAFYNFRL